MSKTDKKRGIEANFGQRSEKLRHQRAKCEEHNCSNWRKLLARLSFLFTDESSNISSFVPHSSMLNSRQLIIYTCVCLLAPVFAFFLLQLFPFHERSRTRHHAHHFGRKRIYRRRRKGGSEPEAILVSDLLLASRTHTSQGYMMMLPFRFAS